MSQLAKIGHLLHQAVRVYLRPYWRLHGVLALAVVVLVAFEVSMPLTIRYLIDAALIPHDANKLSAALALLVVLFATAALARHTLAILRAYLNAELYRDLFSHLTRLMQHLPMGYYDRAQPGHFSPLFDTELLTLSRTLRDLFASGFQAVLQFVVILTTLFILNWRLALALVCLLPLVVLRPQRRLQPTVDAVNQIRLVAERHNATVTDLVASLPLVRAFGRADKVADQIIEAAGRKGPRAKLRGYADVRKVSRTPHFQMLAFKLSMDNQQANLTLFVIVVGAWLSFAGMLTLGTFSAFLLLLPGVIQSISRLADHVQELGRATLSLDRFEQVAAAAAELPADRASLVELPVPAHSIRFERVQFSYTGERPSIRDVSLELPIGRSIALVGRSGSGKSTLLKLLLGFYVPNSGRIAIDGVDLRQVSPASLGAQLGTVLQGSILLHTSIRKNICFAKPDATEDEMVQAAQQAEIHDYIASLPAGYETDVGAGGKWLSEGQKQRIALARAILPNPPILLLDEVTASLDPEAESAINATIRRLAHKKTVIMVTHRLASGRFMDRIAVVDDGRVMEQGTHDELLARQGQYHRFWQMQSGFLVSGDGHHAEVLGARLQAIPLLRGVAIATLDQLAQRFVSEFYQPGHAIYEKGSPGDKFFIVVRGTVTVSTLDASGKSIRLADLQDGDCFGEGEMLSRGRRATSVRTTTPSLVLALRAEHFHAMMDELSSLNKVVTQMALGRSLGTICSVGRRRRSHPVWRDLIPATRA